MRCSRTLGWCGLYTLIIPWAGFPAATGTFYRAHAWARPGRRAAACRGLHQQQLLPTGGNSRVGAGFWCSWWRFMAAVGSAFHHFVREHAGSSSVHLSETSQQPKHCFQFHRLRQALRVRVWGWVFIGSKSGVWGDFQVEFQVPGDGLVVGVMAWKTFSLHLKLRFSFAVYTCIRNSHFSKKSGFNDSTCLYIALSSCNFLFYCMVHKLKGISC